LFCGFSAMTDTFKGWYRWGTYIDPALWSMGIMFVNECHNNDYIFGPFFSYDALVRNYGWNYPIKTMFTYLMFIILANKVLAYLGYRFAKLSSA
jgi:ABC-type multidrug transport system permease subunit